MMLVPSLAVPGMPGMPQMPPMAGMMYPRTPLNYGFAGEMLRPKNDP